MSIRKRIETVLADGPATPTEIAPELGIDKRRLNANMCDLARRGKLARRPFHDDSAARKVVWIYSLPEQAA